MNNIDEYFSTQQQQPPYQQPSIYFIAAINDFALSLGNFSENDLFNITYKYENKNPSQFTSLTYTIIFGLVCACLCFLTITGNLLVLITFRRMQTVGNLFILSLATADLIVGCFVMPLAGIYAIMEKWKMGLVVCQIWISVDYTASTASIFNLLTLSLDRYWSITSPLQYLGKRTRTRALLLIGFAWGLSLLWVIPIFGWHRFMNNGTRMIEPDKCEPEYVQAKGFKVTTAIINFYLPLLVLMSLNGRIYYEIKRRYKNVLLQRHSTKVNDSLTITNNTTNLYNHKLNQQRNISASPITVTLCDSDRQLCSTTVNYTDNESLILSKNPLNNNNNSESILRINFKEKKYRPIRQIRSLEQRKTSLKRTYSFIEKTHCTQDELTWFAHHREHTHSPFPPNSPKMLTKYKYNENNSHRLCVDERCFKHSNDYNSCRIYSNKQTSPTFYQHNHYQTSVICRRCSLIDPIKQSSSTSSPPQPLATTTMNVFNLCHCCSAATSAITIHSNPFVNTSETFCSKRKISNSSSSSLAPTTINRKPQSPLTSLNRITTNNASLTLMKRTNSANQRYHPSNKVKQTTVWNQQEKAFRQLFAIVFGFTCCFLPYFILYMVVAFCESCVSERVVTATIWLGYVNSTMNPFLYALSNKHFRRTFNRLLKRDNRRQSYYN